jgi:endonuclease YncB( thermonuclease family)
MWVKTLILAILFLSISYHAQTNATVNQQCKIVGIVDGDTIDCLINFKTVRIRLHAIDAPEKKQDYYGRSKATLSRICFGKYARLIEHGHDRYRRLIADVYVDNELVNYEMVKLGMAWHFTKYSSDRKLAALQQAARNNKKGLWSLPAPIAPWDYRASRKTAHARSAV